MLHVCMHAYVGMRKGIYDRKRAFKYTDYWEMKHKPCMFNESKFYMVRQKQLNRVTVSRIEDGWPGSTQLLEIGWLKY
jgi:hypothetical protein